MLRELQTRFGKNIDSMYKAGAAMKVGTPVVKKYEDKTVEVAPDNTVSGFFFVRKERIPTDVNCSRVDMSDYDDDFINIAEGEGVTLIPPVFGERYATDLFGSDAESLNIGDPLMVSSGKFIKATVDSALIFGGKFNDAGHNLYIIEIAGLAKSVE